MNQAPVRLGMVGCGYIAHCHATAAQGIPDTAHFAACCDIDEDAAKAFAKKYGCTAYYTDYVEMIRRGDLDGVYLATPPDQHPEQIERCIAAGARNILCEKPLAMYGPDACEIWQRVTTTGTFLMEGFMYRHHPAIRKLERVLSIGDIGAIDHVRANFSYLKLDTADPSDPHRPWRTRPQAGGGALYDVACYAVNACTHFAGGIPTRVAALGSASSRYGTNEQVCGLIEYDNGCVGVVESSETASATQELEIDCTHGVLNLPMAWSLYDEIVIEQRDIVPPEYRDRDRYFTTLRDSYTIPRANAYQCQLKNVAAVILGKAAPAVALAESVVNASIIDALATSMAEKRFVEIRLPDAVARAHAATLGSWQAGRTACAAARIQA